MSDKVGPMSLTSIQNRYLYGSSVKSCSEETETMLDDESRQILFDCRKKATDLLRNNRGSLDRIAEYLLKRKTSQATNS